jgi:hypothetical protein
MSQFTEPVIPDERRFAGRDPWFDRLTTLSEVEGESSESDELRHSLLAIRSESSNSGTDVSTRKDLVFSILDARW